jgi:hypothetical protein
MIAKMTTAIAVALGLVVACAANAQQQKLAAAPATSVAAATTSGPFAAIAGMTCKGYWEFSHPSIYDQADGAIWFEPGGAAGSFQIWSKIGRNAKDQWSRVASHEGYTPNQASLASDDNGLAIIIDDSKYGTVLHLAATGSATFKFKMTKRSGSGPWFGEVKCSR